MIIKLTDQGREYYLIWSTVVDAPTTPGLSLDELKTCYEERYGPHLREVLERQLCRVESNHGTSSLVDSSVEETVAFNRAGQGETCLSVERIIDFYCRRQGQGENPVGTESLQR